MPGQKISTLTPVSDLQAADQFPLARSGSTYKITGDKFASKAQLDSLSATATGSFALKTDITGLSSTVDAKFIPKPASASAQQVLTYSGSTATWVASAAPMIPVGSVAAFPFTTNPVGWLKLNGALLNRADYPELWSAAQSSGNIVTEAVWTATNTGSFSTGNLSTTFRIPDLRGEFVRGWDDSRGVDSGRGIGVYQVDAFKAHRHLLLFKSLPGANTSVPIEPVLTENYQAEGYSDSQVSLEGGTETRPRNASLLYCIKF